MDPQQLSHFIMRYERVYFMVSRKISALVSSKIGEDLTLEQHYAIRYLAVCDRRSTVSELAEALFVKPSAVTAQMNRLVARGLVQRVRNEEDRRVVYLSLTDLGLKIYQDCERRIHDVIKPYIRQLPEHEIEHFLKTYEKIDAMIKDES